MKCWRCGQPLYYKSGRCHRCDFVNAARKVASRLDAQKIARTNDGYYPHNRSPAYLLARRLRALNFTLEEALEFVLGVGVRR